jgi:hypothetical protein
MMAIHDDCCDTPEKTREAMKKYVRNRAEFLKYLKRNLIMLSGKNIRTNRSFKKPHYQLHDPFEITDSLSESAMHLDLTVKWKIQKGFHISVLDPFIYRNYEINLKKVLDATNPIEADDEYQVKDIKGSVQIKVKVAYLVK